MKTIQLTQGQVALVDDEDFERVNQYKWNASYDKRHKVYYARGFINKKRIKMHRFILGVTDPKVLVDHKFHKTLDNRKSELRICNNSGNSANALKSNSLRSSRFKGVSFRKKANKWKAEIVLNKKHLVLGNFLTQEAAAHQYNQYAQRHFGEFACLNELSDDEMAIALSHPEKKEATSNYRGVSWDKEKNKWCSKINQANNAYHLGFYNTEQAAALAYNQKASELFGEFAFLNSLSESDEIIALSHIPKKVNTSKHKGVYFNQKTNRWIVDMRKNGKRCLSAQFYTEQQAIDAVNVHVVGNRILLFT